VVPRRPEFPGFPFPLNNFQKLIVQVQSDTARYISDAIGQQTISFETTSRSYQEGRGFQPGTQSSGRGEHLQGRPLLTPDEVMRLGPKRPVVMIAGEPPYLLDRIDYFAGPAYAGRFDPNPMHLGMAAE
jgi:type IV secretory pathway TraG/TraD family ATPase VirD4